MIFNLSIQQVWASKHIDFENAVSSGILERSVYPEILAHIFTEEQREGKIFKLRRSLKGLKEAARTWNKLLFKALEECGLKEMATAPCVFKKNNTVVVCYVDYFLLVTEREGLILENLTS